MFDFNKLEKLDTGIPGQNPVAPSFDFNKLPTVQAPAVETPKPGFIQSAVQDIAKPFLKTIVSPYAVVKGAVELAKGKNEEAAKTATKEYDFGYFGKVKPLGAEISPTAGVGETLLQGGKEAVGTALELASNFVGGGGTAGVGKSLLKSELKKAIIGGVKTGATMGALGAGGRSLQENESLGNVALNTAVGTGVGAALGAGLGVAGVGLKSVMTPLSTVTQKIAPALESMAGKIETTVLKPTKVDFQNGFKAENVLKHDLGGTVKDTIEKATAKLKDLRQQATALRSGTTEVVNLSDIVKQTADDIANNKIGGFGVNRKMENAFADFVKELEYISPNGKLTVPQAQEVKEALGTFGSWLYGAKDLDATAQERVANILYSKVKTAIEKNSPKELGEINKQMSEIIPIKNAAIRRLPIEERNNTIGLGDIISAGVALQNPTGWGLMIANQLQKSGKFAQALYKGAGTLSTKATNLQKKLPGLRISPETLLNRNQSLRTGAIKNTEKSILPSAAKKTAMEKPAEIILPKNETKPMLNVIDKAPAKKVTEPKLRTTNGAEELTFQRAPKLTKKDREIETKAIKKFVRNKDKMINDYIAENGKVANADNARKLFKDVGYQGYNSAAVQEPSSALNKEVFRKLLKDNPEKNVIIYAGGSGSGKTSAIKSHKSIKKAISGSAAILDGNLSSYKSALDRLKEVAESGKVARFVYVYRDPIDAFENGVVKRMKFNKAEAGRIVPAKVVAGNHKESLEVIKKLYQEAPDKLKKNFKFVDNSLGENKSKLMTYDELLKKEIPSDLEKKLIAKSQELYANKTINKRELKKYLE